MFLTALFLCCRCRYRFVLVKTWMGHHNSIICRGLDIILLTANFLLFLFPPWWYCSPLAPAADQMLLGCSGMVDPGGQAEALLSDLLLLRRRDQRAEIIHFLLRKGFSAGKAWSNTDPRLFPKAISGAFVLGPVTLWRLWTVGFSLEGFN